ncbi:MAG: sugar phosphate nucleotidyltransferase [Candidatus Thorarchaeota archaeon]
MGISQIHHQLECDNKLKAILPIAGKGVRLKPITDGIPKVLIEVAGKPALGHILDNLAGSPVKDLVLIVGHMKERIIEWTEEFYGDRFSLHFVTQDKQLGLGHALYCAKDFLEGEIVISLGDEIFSRRYSSMLQELDSTNGVGASIGIKHVNDPSHYGMVKTDEEGYIVQMVEKPPVFDGDQAIAGIYHIRKGKDLKKALEDIIGRENNGKEYQLTDALQLLLERGTIMTAFEVGEWYDCGRLETILDSNRRLVDKYNSVDASAKIIDSEIIPPCVIGANVTISKSTIGPHVSIGNNSAIENSIIHDAIIEPGTDVKDRNGSEFIVSKDGFLSE